MPAASEAFAARDPIARLGAFLTELVSERPAVVVHADILQRLSTPDHDPRLAGVASMEQFAGVWAVLEAGSSLPPRAWESVVLPTVVAFSNPNELKAHLEKATSQWMAASAALNGPAEPHADPELGDSTALWPSAWQPAADLADVKADVKADVTAKIRGEASSGLTAEVMPDEVIPATVLWSRRALIVVIVVALLFAAGFLWWSQSRDPVGGNGLPPPPLPAGDGQSAAASPVPSTGAGTGQPLPVDNTGPTPVSNQPVPLPTWTGVGPVAPPTAPRQLAVIGTAVTTVALSWQPPADAGTGGLAYYRIWRDGTDAGWTAQTSGTVTGLAPSTSYTFTVTAHNGAGVASPHSNSVTATTATPQPQQNLPPTPVPRTGPPAAGPTLATDPPQTPIDLGQSFTVTGSGWPCSAPSTVKIYLGGKLVATPDTNAQGAFRTTIAVDASQPAAPKVAVIGSAQPLTLNRGIWLLAAQLPTQASCTATPDQSIQIVFR